MPGIAVQRRLRVIRLVRIVARVVLGAALVVVALRQLGVLQPFSPLAGLGTALLAGSLMELTRGNGPRARFVAVLALLVAGVALVTVARPATLPASLNPGWAVTAILLTGALTLLIATFTPPFAEQFALGAGGFVLAAMGAVALFVRLTGLVGSFESRGFESIPLLMALGALLLGISALAMAWTNVTEISAVPRWAPSAAAIAGVVASLFLWRTLAIRETAENARLLEQAATGRARAIEREVGAVGRVLLEFALFYDRGDADSSTALTLLRRDLPAVDVIALIDSAGYPTIAVPANGDLVPIARTVPARAVARPGATPNPVAVLEIPGDTTRVVIHAARCFARSCPGGVAAVVEPGTLNQVVTAGRASDWRFAVSPPHAYQPRNQLRYTVPLPLGDVAWTLVASPSPVALTGNRSILPEVALLMGLFSTALLTVVIRFGGEARENARAVERMKFAAAITTATDAVWEWEVDRGLLQRSGELWRHLGYDPTEREQTLREWLDLIHRDDRDRVASEFAFIADGRQSEFDLEYQVRSRPGSWHTLVDRGRVIDRNPDGTPALMLGVTADVTASRLAERQLREVEALSGIGRIAARTAHEINNPLAGIRSAFLLIKDAVPADHPHHRYVGAIEREIERIASVTRNLYETYRPEPDQRGASLSTIASDAVSLLSEINRASNVEIEITLDGVPGVVPVSGAMLRQIVYNLLQNAIDASPVGGTIDLIGRIDEGDLLVEVRDQGHGVPPELRERIFEPFFTTKETGLRTSGLGLGLAMVARSVEAAGGRITVGDTPGGGATFTVRLPFTREGTPA